MRRTTAFLATALLVAAGAEARSASVSVPLDEVRMIAFAKPVSTLYVGNPVVADVTMIDKSHAFVLGKSFGATNIIALDAYGAEISNQQVIVSGASGAIVTLHKGAAQITYACAAQRCETAPQPGDAKDHYDVGMDQIQKHQELGTKTASGQTQ